MIMKKTSAVIIAAMLTIAVSGCSAGGGQSSEPQQPSTSTSASTSAASQETTSKAETTTEAKPENEHVVTLKLQSKALADSVVPQKTEQDVTIYLPPSYYAEEKAYPVVYYLHGFGESSKNFITSSRKALDTAFKEGAKEFIFVGVNGRSEAGGSFYANSPVSGNWEDYTVQEVTALVDENYRTIKESASRGICGFSMGGYGAVNLALKHPDVYGGVFAMSPGLLADDDLKAALASWSRDTTFKTSYAQAFSPNKEDTVIFGNIPELTGTPEDKKIAEDWENGFGNINQKVDDYLALDKPLKAIKVIYGKIDSYAWIPRGCEFFSACLNEKKIEHTLEVTAGTHSLPPQVIEAQIVPFFNVNLSY